MPSPNISGLSGADTLIFGAGGFVGAHLMRALEGRSVVGVVRRKELSWRLVHTPPSSIVEADITGAGEINRIISELRPTTIINAASYGVAPHERDAEVMRAVNVTAVKELLNAAATHDVRRVVHLGSCSEYGDTPETVTEDSPLHPKDSYGASKAEASRLVIENSSGSAVDAIVMRLFNIWGPLESTHRLLPSVIQHCRKRLPLDLTTGTQQKDYSFAPDLARWIVGVASHSRRFSSRVINCASGKQIAVKDMVLAVATKLNGTNLMRFGAKKVPANEVQSGPVDTILLNTLLPHRTLTPLSQAIDEMLSSPEPPQ